MYINTHAIAKQTKGHQITLAEPTRTNFHTHTHTHTHTYPASLTHSQFSATIWRTPVRVCENPRVRASMSSITPERKQGLRLFHICTFNLCTHSPAAMCKCVGADDKNNTNSHMHTRTHGRKMCSPMTEPPHEPAHPSTADSTSTVCTRDGNCLDAKSLITINPLFDYRCIFSR